MLTPARFLSVGPAAVIALFSFLFVTDVSAVSNKSFLKAVDKGKLERVQKYLGEDVSDTAKRQGLVKAIKAGNEPMVELIFEDVAPDGDSLRVIIYAGRLDLAQRLHERGAVITDLEAFLRSARYAEEDQLLAMLEVGEGLTGQGKVKGLKLEDINQGVAVFRKYESPEGMTALGIAAERGFDRLAAALLAKDADPNVVITVEPGGPNGGGWKDNPLMVGSTLTMSTIGVGTIMMPAKGTALTLAVGNEHLAVVRILMDAGADPLLPHSEGVDACKSAEGGAMSVILADVCAAARAASAP